MSLIITGDLSPRIGLVTISAEIPNIDSVIQAVNRAQQGKGLQYTADAVKAATVDVVQRTWIEYASGAQVSYSGGTFRIHSISGQYLRSIQNGLRFLDDMTGEVFSDSPHGRLIEDGQNPHDMKPGLLNSPKAKVGKDGKRFVTVPFRHGTPGAVTMPAMPKSVYNQAAKLTYSRRQEGLGVPQKTVWGGRLGESSIGQRSHINPHPGGGQLYAPGGDPNAGKGYTWKTGLYTGMVRVGKPGHSQYLTFRRVSDNSDPRSWQHPGTKPRPIREAVVENTREEVLQLIRRGFEMDLYFMGLGGG